MAFLLKWVYLGFHSDGYVIITHTICMMIYLINHLIIKISAGKLYYCEYHWLIMLLFSPLSSTDNLMQAQIQLLQSLQRSSGSLTQQQQQQQPPSAPSQAGGHGGSQRTGSLPPSGPQGNPGSMFGSAGGFPTGKTLCWGNIKITPNLDGEGGGRETEN